MLERVLAAAAWAPSGSNLQPWHAYVLTCEPLVPSSRSAQAGRFREPGPLRRAGRPVLLRRPRPGPAAVVRRRHVTADRDAAAPRGRAAQLPTDAWSV
ncbi:nitroreductase family protein [Nonomuraea diastatica]|uniref:nitroreductase family protein n=1 Tax=Nonomuraea diastatica TaxID=1848329 RepID=UPI001FE44429|nr:nitroreductase family protein [Nonomuraea diastatica]